MRKINIPNLGDITIKNIIFDINGTLQFKGKIDANLVLRFQDLKKYYNIYLVSSDTRGNLREIAKKLEVDFIKINASSINDAESKLAELDRLGPEITVAVGNGNNDVMMLKNAVIGICIMGAEGASSKCLLNSDVVFHDPISAIDFLLDEKMMIATLRT
ncbi:MAG: HAD family hydrolase [Candidatus Lokiarchaeota archaeon]|nr:HAD family hydrolase [Candidatus Lokiarchaeota archaeon]